MLEQEALRKEKLERQKNAVIRILYWVLILATVFLFVKYLLPVLMPFVIAYLVAWLLNRPITWLSQKLHLPRGIVGILVIILFTLLVSGVLTLLGAALFSWMQKGLTMLPEFLENGVFPFLKRFLDRIESIAALIDPVIGMTLGSSIDGMFKILNEGIVGVCGGLISALGKFITGVPFALMRLIITLIACIFIVIDFDTIRRFLYRLLPTSLKRVLREGGAFFGKTLPRCLLSYAAILFITFLELFLGLGILRVPSAVFIAFFIAILDILPVLGTGTILIPWAVISFVNGQIRQGVGLLILYGVITLIRNMLEPRLVGKQIHLHPVVTFAGMLVGLHFFGIIGLLGVPLTLSFLRFLHEQGTLRFSILDEEKRAPAAEEPTARKE